MTILKLPPPVDAGQAREKGLSKAAIYARISEDPRSRGGVGAGVDAQIGDCYAFADREGYDVVAVYRDDDLTAADLAVVRPGFDELMESVLIGEIDVVITTTQDRLVRLPEQLEEVMAKFIVGGVLYKVVTGASDFVSPEGKLFARVNTLLGAYEIEKIKLRTARTMLDRADKGLPPGGVAGFGLMEDKVTVDEDEAELIKEGATRVLAGEALAAICRDWNERGLTLRGRPWRGVSLSRVLQAPRVAGLRVHQGRIHGSAAWPEIIDRPTYDRVCKVLTHPSRRSPGSRRQKLLTGIVLCGKCSETLNHKSSKPKGGKYYCRHCYGSLVSASQLERRIQLMVIEAVDAPQLVEDRRRQAESDGTADLVAELDQVEELLEFNHREYMTRQISQALYLECKADLSGQATRLRRALDRQRDESVLEQWIGNGADLEDAWDGLTHGARRAIIQAVFSEIKLGSARLGFNRFDPERIKVKWQF